MRLGGYNINTACIHVDYINIEAMRSNSDEFWYRIVEFRARTGIGRNLCLVGYFLILPIYDNVMDPRSR